MFTLSKKFNTHSFALGALLFVFACTFMVSNAQVASAQQGGYGGNNVSRVEICRAVSSRFMPYVKLTVPSFIADRWVATGSAILPTNGACPTGVPIRDYVRGLLDSIFGR